MSSDWLVEKRHFIPMAGASEFRRGYTARTRQARERAGYEIADMATLLDLKLDTYQKYEARTPLPRQLVPKFCLICGVSANWLFGMEEEAKKAKRVVSPGVRRSSIRGGKRSA